MSLRDLDELEAVNSPAWPEIAGLVGAGRAHVLSVDPAQGRQVLFRLQVTAGSYLGALALSCGGIIADRGWFRLYGGGSTRLPDLATVNGLGEPSDATSPPGYLLIGADALGGRFAIDGGALGVSPGEVCYFGPDSLTWGGLGGGHSAFVRAVLDGSMAETFESLRWPGWEVEIESLDPDQGIALYPPPFSVEGRDPSKVSRRAVPIAELFGFYKDAAAQLR